MNRYQTFRQFYTGDGQERIKNQQRAQLEILRQIQLYSIHGFMDETKAPETGSLEGPFKTWTIVELETWGFLEVEYKRHEETVRVHYITP